jgi:UDP:flavonoid glycosyltransferase YjiC (YdhE family)
VKRLKVGTARRFSATSRRTLIADLRTILNPECATEARRIAGRMTTPSAATAVAASLLEDAANVRPVDLAERS